MSYRDNAHIITAFLTKEEILRALANYIVWREGIELPENWNGNFTLFETTDQYGNNGRIRIIKIARP